MKTRTLCVLFAMTALCGAGPGDGYPVTDLGTLDPQGVEAVSVSAVSSAASPHVVGSTGGHAFVWQDGVMTDLGEGYATAVNASGQIVGYSYSYVGPSLAWLWDPVQGFTDLAPWATWGFAPYGINDSGQVVGTMGAFYANSSAVLLDGGSVTDLGHVFGDPENGASGAAAINQAGHVVGSSGYDTYRELAFLWNPASGMQSLGVGGNNYATAINDLDEVVGVLYPYGPPYADTRVKSFLSRNGSVTEIVVPGSSDTRAYGINDSGQIVGSYEKGAFLLHQGVLIDLNSLLPADSGWVLREARAINDAGVIVGTGTLDSREAAFLMTVPPTDVLSAPAARIDGDPPAAPTGITATLRYYGVELSWTAASGAKWYDVKRALSAGGPYTTSGQTAETHMLEQSRLEPDTTYYFVVTARNAFGSRDSESVSVTTPPPGPPNSPSNLTATAGKGTVTLQWTQSTSRGVTGNLIYRAKKSGGSYALVASVAASNVYVDAGLNDGNYFYRVRAVNGFGLLSDYSNEAKAHVR